MNTQHTPGPWNVTGLYVRERDGGLVASINDLWHDQKTPKGEKNANAQLIAAAPDLLALAYDFGQMLTGMDPYTVDDASIMRDKIKAIIARATGAL